MLTQLSRFILYGEGTYDMRNKPTLGLGAFTELATQAGGPSRRKRAWLN